MFRNSYDTDVTLWSPQGRLFQVEYAMEAVKQGSAAVGVKSKTHVVLASLKRAPHAELSSYQKKLFCIDRHLGIAIAGLTADARVLSRFMRNECLNHRYVFDSPIQTGRLVLMVADKSQVCTQQSSKRPYGVGLLVAGVDEQTGPHLFQTCPSGNFYEYKSISIGARSQSAKTYLEKNFEQMDACSRDDLVKHALRALRETTGENVELNSKNTAVGIVGIGEDFRIYEDEEVEEFVRLVREDQPPSSSPGDSDSSSGPAAQMADVAIPGPDSSSGSTAPSAMDVE